MKKTFKSAPGSKSFGFKVEQLLPVGPACWLPEVGYRCQSRNTAFPEQHGKWLTVIKRLGGGCVRVQFDNDTRLLREQVRNLHRADLHGEMLVLTGATK